MYAQSASKWRPAGEVGSIQNAQHAESDYRQHDVAAIYPRHLSMKSRERAQLLAPVQTKWNQRRGDEKEELSDAGAYDITVPVFGLAALHDRDLAAWSLD